MGLKIPTYKCSVGDLDNTGILAVSFVECPAIESNFIALNKPVAVKLNIDRQKRLLTGALLIPDKLIYRNDNSLGEYNIIFSKEEIEKIALKMMRKRDSLDKTTHQHETGLKNNHLAELWIVNDPKRDKSVALGLGELPAGTLVVSYKIEDAAYWRSEVLSGNVKGFSLEGIFNFNNVQMSKNTKTAAQLGKEQAAAKKGSKVSAFLRSMAAMLEGDTMAEADALADEAKKDETGSGAPVMIFDLQDGGEVRADADGFCTLEGEQMPAGQHALADGNFIVVDDAGLLVVTEPEADAEQPAEAAAALAKARVMGKKFLAKQGRPADPKTAKIEALKKQIAELEKQPSTEPAKPTVEATAKKPSEMTHTEKMAAVIRSRQERAKGK